MLGIILDNGDSSKNEIRESSLLSGSIHSGGEYAQSSEPGCSQFPARRICGCVILR